jgi:hypothetical protein
MMPSPLRVVLRLIASGGSLKGKAGAIDVANNMSDLPVGQWVWASACVSGPSIHIGKII